MAFKDPYILQPSQQFNVTGRQEVGQDLDLFDAPDFGSIVGTVQDSVGDPIAYATVKVFAQDGIPFEHTNTNESGQFLFDEIPAGSYTLTSSKAGLLTTSALPATIVENGTASIAFTMLPDPNAETITVYGRVLDALGDPIASSKVELFIENAGVRQSVASVTTNPEGQYLFTELVSGIYVVDAGKAGYFSAETVIGEITDPSFNKYDVTLDIDPNFDTGTVSGIVNDMTTGLPIANAIVALYSIVGGTESMVRITRTNADGLYLFGNVGSGDYLVKATVQENV